MQLRLDRRGQRCQEFQSRIPGLSDRGVRE